MRAGTSNVAVLKEDFTMLDQDFLQSARSMGDMSRSLVTFLSFILSAEHFLCLWGTGLASLGQTSPKFALTIYFN